jgi:hypothetical protein
MKNIKTFAVAGVLGLAVCGFAIAQAHRGGVWAHGSIQCDAESASAVEHLTEAFAKIAAFDANKDGQLDETERESLAHALVDGTLQLPPHKLPNGAKPGVEMMVTHIGEMYAQFAKYDANHDGVLDKTEQDTIRAAMEKGDFVCPLGQNPHSLAHIHQ